MTVTDLPKLIAEEPTARTAKCQARDIAADLEAFPFTPAELRIVPYLATNLSLAEISRRLHVTRNTVKTQTHSIYRKLGVSSRLSAVEALIGLELLPDVFSSAARDRFYDTASTCCPLCGHPTPTSHQFPRTSDN